MTITPLAAAAVPAGIAAVKLARHVQANQPFRQLLSRADETTPAEDAGDVDFPSLPGEQMQQFQSLVQERLAAAGISTSIRFEITSDAAGNLQIAGDHPHRAEIMRALLNDPEIAEAFHRLAAAHQREQSAQRHEQFAQAYLDDGTKTLAPDPKTPSKFAILINGESAKIVGT